MQTKRLIVLLLMLYVGVFLYSYNDLTTEIPKDFNIVGKSDWENHIDTYNKRSEMYFDNYPVWIYYFIQPTFNSILLHGFFILPLLFLLYCNIYFKIIKVIDRHKLIIYSLMLYILSSLPVLIIRNGLIKQLLFTELLLLFLIIFLLFKYKFKRTMIVLSIVGIVYLQPLERTISYLSRFSFDNLINIGMFYITIIVLFLLSISKKIDQARELDYLFILILILAIFLDTRFLFFFILIIPKLVYMVSINKGVKAWDLLKDCGTK